MVSDRFLDKGNKKLNVKVLSQYFNICYMGILIGNK